MAYDFTINISRTSNFNTLDKTLSYGGMVPVLSTGLTPFSIVYNLGWNILFSNMLRYFANRDLKQLQVNLKKETNAEKRQVIEKQIEATAAKISDYILRRNIGISLIHHALIELVPVFGNYLSYLKYKTDERLARDIAKIVEESNAQKEKINTSETKSKEKETKIMTLEAKIMTLEESALKAEEQIKKLLNDATNTINSESENESGLKLKVKKLEEDLLSQSTELGNYIEENKGGAQKINSLNGEINKLNNDINKLLMEKDSLNIKIKTLAAENNRLRLEKVPGDVKNHELFVSAIEKERDTLNEQVTDLQLQISELEKEITKDKSAIKEHLETIDQLRKSSVPIKFLSRAQEALTIDFEAVQLALREQKGKDFEFLQKNNCFTIINGKFDLDPEKLTESAQSFHTLLETTSKDQTVASEILYQIEKVWGQKIYHYILRNDLGPIQIPVSEKNIKVEVQENKKSKVSQKVMGMLKIDTTKKDKKKSTEKNDTPKNNEEKSKTNIEDNNTQTPKQVTPLNNEEGNSGGTQVKRKKSLFDKFKTGKSPEKNNN